MKSVVFLLVVGSSFAVAADTPQGEAGRLETTVKAMGTDFRLIAYGDDSSQLRSGVEKASAEILRLDRMLSNYLRTSEWSCVNQSAGTKPVRVSPELFDLLSKCVEYSRVSEGAFDISVGALMRVWGFYKGSGRLPPPTEVQQTLAHVGYRNIVLDQGGRMVTLKNGVELDPGGIGKGYTVDRVVAVLKQSGIRSALVSAGGSSIYGLGVPPTEARGWRATIRDPRDTTQTATEVYLRNESLSTSGDYEKSFSAAGKLYGHIMDPRTGYPAEGMLSVSVIAPMTLDSEAWTKPYFILGREWAERHKPQAFRVFLCEDGPQASKSCHWIQ